MKHNFLRNLTLTVFACVISLAAVAQTQNSIVLYDGTGQSMTIFSNPDPVSSGPGVVQFVPNAGTLIGTEAYSVGLIAGTSGDFYCHHGSTNGGGTGVCYFLDSSTDHLANSASQAIQGDAVGPSGPDFFADLRVNEYGSWEASTGATPGTSRGTFRVVPGTFVGLTSCSSGLEGTTAAVTDSTTAAWGATITGAGTHHVLAYCDGTNWTVAAK